MESLVERRENLCLKFAIKCTNHQKLCKMFPLNKNLHPMKQRVQNKFTVQYANTERLRKYSIIYMQNLLNENEVRKQEMSQF